MCNALYRIYQSENPLELEPPGPLAGWLGPLVAAPVGLLVGQGSDRLLGRDHSRAAAPDSTTPPCGPAVHVANWSGVWEGNREPRRK